MPGLVDFSVPVTEGDKYVGRHPLRPGAGAPRTDEPRFLTAGSDLARSGTAGGPVRRGADVDPQPGRRRGEDPVRAEPRARRDARAQAHGPGTSCAAVPAVAAASAAHPRPAPEDADRAGGAPPAAASVPAATPSTPRTWPAPSQRPAACSTRSTPPAVTCATASRGVEDLVIAAAKDCAPRLVAAPHPAGAGPAGAPDGVDQPVPGAAAHRAPARDGPGRGAAVPSAAPAATCATCSTTSPGTRIVRSRSPRRPQRPTGRPVTSRSCSNPSPATHSCRM